MKALAILLLAFAGGAMADVDPRFIGEPARYADGTIKRSTYQRALFVRRWPCPANAQTTGTCPGWAVDHVIPLVCGGIDAPMNMQWLPLVIKAGPGQFPKDRWERKVYCVPQQLVPMPNGTQAAPQ